VKIEISPHAKRRLKVRTIPENLVADAVKNPDSVLYDRRSGYFIAAKKIEERLLIVAYLMYEDRAKIITAFMTSDFSIVEKRIKRGRWTPL